MIAPARNWLIFACADCADATDALAAAYCHYLEQTRAARLGHAGGGARSWAEFVRQNQNRVSRPTPTRITPELCKKLSK